VIEVPEYAMGMSEPTHEQLAEQVDDLADDIEDWLSETREAWGQRCTVPRPPIPTATTLT
jgi:hypothetical protein